MKTLRAFVGHSFTADDEQLVAKFLKYLDAIEEINPLFMWEHAERPEPSGIDEKVLRLFENKNIFIGICTRKELVIHPSKLQSVPLLRTKRLADNDDFEWKTSDWIIQEIGLAIGRGLDIILLIEDGIRSPGGVQGSLEYISFRRESPEAAFEKLLQMIASLSSKDATSAETTPVPSDTPDTTAKDQDLEHNWLMPDHTWRRRNYEYAFMHYTAVGQADRASEIERAFLQSASAQSEGESWPAFAEYMRILLSKDGKLKKLKEFAGENPRSADTARYLALAYKELGEDLAAAETFVIAAELEADSEKKIRLLGDAVDAAIGKHVDFAADALAKAKSIGEGNSDLAPSILSIEHSFSKARKEAGFEFASLERLLEMEPDDHSKRFELAYAYAEAGMGNMALFHYRLIPATAREDGVWNNLGAAYESQKLPIKAVNSYKKAEELGNTLAMSNLAYRFLHAGFLDEARKLCEVAVTLPEHHKNVDSALAAIKGALDAENDAEDKLISSAQDCSSFYRRVGTALLANGIADVLGKWKYEELELDVSIENGRFIATGVLEQNVLGLRRLHLGEHKPEIYDVSINGVLRGRAVQGFYEKKRRGSHSILGALAVEAKEDFLLCLSEDGETIEVMRGKGERRLGTMHRIVDGAKVISQPA